MFQQSANVLLVETDSTRASGIIAALRETYPAAHIEWASTESQALEFLFHTGLFAEQTAAGTPVLALINAKALQGQGLQLLRIMKS